MIKLSVAIITYNEEKNISRCLESVKDIADEIVVIDSGSQDATQKICKDFGCVVVENPFPGHIQQKNLAIDKCTYDHILSLDADEALDDRLKSEIKKIKENWKSDGYEFNRLTRYVDVWVKWGAWYPDKKLRLFRKDKARWGGVNPHDIIQMNEGSFITHISGDLLHYSYHSISDHIAQTDKFTTIAAKAMFESGKRSSFGKIFIRPWFNFFKDYILKAGFKGGYYGLVISAINAFYVFLKYSKLKELEDQS